MAQFKIRVFEEMVAKINFVHTYLRIQGSELREVKANSNCFCYAFIGRYKTLRRKTPLLDNCPEEIVFFRGQIASQYERSPQGSKNSFKIEEIKQEAKWITAFNEGDLLAVALSIPIRMITVNIENIKCRVHDTLTFTDRKKSRQDWDITPNYERPLEYIIIVDVGALSLCSTKTSIKE